MKKFFITVFVLLVIAVITAVLSLNYVVKRQIEKVASDSLGVKVSVGGVDVSPFAGTIKLTNFEVKNPEGFSGKNIFDLGEVYVKIDNAQKKEGFLTFGISNILVTDPQIHNEVTTTGNNIAVLKAKLSKRENKPDTVPAKETADGGKDIVSDTEAASRRVSNTLVSIENFEVKNTKIELTQQIIGNTTSEITIPNIRIRNVGDHDQPIFVEDALNMILEKFINSIVEASATKGLQGQVQGILDNAIQNGLQDLGLGNNNAPAAQEPATETEVQPAQ